MAFSGELRGINKSYAKVQANRNVNLHVRAQTIHALVGENGAGKSTAMKILFGMVSPDSGGILYDGKAVENWNPQHAFRHGIGMVHQHFMLAEPESVHDNLVLGAESTRWGVRNRKLERAKLEELMTATGLKLPLDVKIENLSIGLQSRCEILKVLYREAKFLILDEPTAVLTPQEIEELLNTLKRLRDGGKTILIVTHKLKEVMAVADEVTVLHAGQTVATRRTQETNVEELSELMVGRRLQMPRVSPQKKRGRVLAKIEMPNYSLELRAGEITGIAGVEGSGQEILFQTLIEMRKLPLAIIPADRHKEGLLLPFTLSENLRLSRKQITTSMLRIFPRPTVAEKKTP